MGEVYPLWRLVGRLINSSITHVGAAATSAALRDELVRSRFINAQEFDTIFAAARLTPGTNLIALFAGVGSRLHGLGGAIAAVTTGLAPSVAISIAVCWLYLRFSAQIELTNAIAGASAAAVSVLVWAALKFLLAPFRDRAAATLTLVAVVIGLQMIGAPPLVLLLGSAVVGAFLFDR